MATARKPATRSSRCPFRAAAPWSARSLGANSTANLSLGKARPCFHRGGSSRDAWNPYGSIVDMESSSEGDESATDLAGSPGCREAHDLATLAAVVDGGEEVSDYVDKHDEWLAATRDWTFDEIRSVLYGEASDSASMGGGLMPVAGWCRCGDHADLIEGFLSEYGLRYDEEGWLVDMLEGEEEEDDG